MQILSSRSTRRGTNFNSRYARLKAIFGCEVDLETEPLEPVSMLPTFFAT